MIILDTSFIVGYKIENDAHRENATKMIKEIADLKYGRPVISDYIFDETVTVVFSRSKNLQLSVEIGNDLKNSVEVIKIDDLLFEETWKIFESQKGTRFCFTDCTTLALMKNRNISNIATFDEDFGKMKQINVIKEPK